jgi:hypothetical protein
MEKDPLRGNSSIPMSFPASYQAVGGQVIFSSVEPTIRFKNCRCLLRNVTFQSFHSHFVMCKLKFCERCNNINLDFTVFDQSYIYSRILRSGCSTSSFHNYIAVPLIFVSLFVFSAIRPFLYLLFFFVTFS